MNTQSKRWYVKELSELTKITVRTLHHYDKIGLLKPSLRLSNGYRLYSELDLLKLQQILALKFLGFDLNRIKILVQGKINAIDHLQAQKQLLDEKTRALQQASQVLAQILETSNANNSVSWETVINLIEVYQMTKALEKSWEAKIFTPEELKRYASFEAGLQINYTKAEKDSFEQNWKALVEEITANLNKDPSSDIGITLGKRCMDMINPLYGTENADLKKTIWEKGFKSGNISDDRAIPPNVVQWLDKAIETYYRQRVYSILRQATSEVPTQEVTQLWIDFVKEMCGNSQVMKDELYSAAMIDDKINDTAKDWLRKGLL